MSKHTLVFAAFLSLCVLPAVSIQAQGTDFSGTWTLDRDASQIPEGRGGGRGGGGGGRGGFGGAGTVVITQSETELSMEQEARGQTRTVVYRRDGSESTSSGSRGEMITTSQWDGAAFLTEGTNSISTPRGDMTIEIKERRTLSPDGQTMTVESTRTMPFGEMHVTLVYRKSS